MHDDNARFKFFWRAGVSATCFINRQHSTRVHSWYNVMANDVAIRFEAETLDWREKLQVDEWLFQSLREEILTALTPSEAFENIGDMAESVMRQSDPTLCFESGLLLLELVRKSATTQID